VKSGAATPGASAASADVVKKIAAAMAAEVIDAGRCFFIPAFLVVGI
jgi:hypothetical protein